MTDRQVGDHVQSIKHHDTYQCFNGVICAIDRHPNVSDYDQCAVALDNSNQVFNRCRACDLVNLPPLSVEEGLTHWRSEVREAYARRKS